MDLKKNMFNFSNGQSIRCGRTDYIKYLLEFILIIVQDELFIK